ncbi:MAG: purine-nucleoside phosphorylase [Planctomycetota bacterium]|nr:purine-nucleoside phosphorylase [Planctomycetota bacterium]
MDEYDRVQEAAAFLKPSGTPRAFIILGTGLGGLGESVEGAVRVPYTSIPHFPRSTAPGHQGELIFGRLADTPVAVMAGRVHFYEGYSLQDVTRPVRVARALGAKTLIVTSAVGGLNPDLEKGEVVAIDDHINLMGDSPIRGPNDERIGPRFPDMSAPYDAAFLDHLKGVRRCVLAAVPGPQLETPAEYRFLHRIGADLVGMSTVPEVIAAVHVGLRNCAFSVVTDMCLPDELQPVDIEEMIAVANAAAPELERLVLGVLPLA